MPASLGARPTPLSRRPRAVGDGPPTGVSRLLPRAGAARGEELRGAGQPGGGRGLRVPGPRQVGLELPDPALPPEGGRNPGEKPDENTDPEGSDDDHKDGGVSGIVKEPDRNETRVLDREHRDDPQKDDENDEDRSPGGEDYITRNRCKRPEKFAID